MKIRNRLPIVLSATALAVAVLGSTPLGQAAGRIVVPGGSVGTLQLKNGAVTDLKIKKHSLTAANFKLGELPKAIPGPQGIPGAQGPAGPQGAAGNDGARGPSGVTGWHIVTQLSGMVAPGQKGLAIALCAAGEKPLGGGMGSNIGGPWTIDASEPLENQPRYVVSAYNAGAVQSQFAVHVICATVG